MFLTPDKLVNQSMAEAIFKRFSEPFAHALAVFVRESCQAGLFAEAEGRDKNAGNQQSTDPLQKHLDQLLARSIKENDRLAKSGKLASVEVTADSASKVVATRLRWIIKERGLSQTELAKKVGVAPPVISRLLRNPDRSRVATLRKIAEALDVDLHNIL